MLESFSLSKKEKDACLLIARKAIEAALKDKKYVAKKVPEKLKEKKACFVTLTKHGRLRGCIGHLKATQELYKDLIESAKNAAFSDNRFSPLQKDELSQIKIEVSILTDPVEVLFDSPENLLTQIVERRDGLIISKGHAGATFLPSVWDSIKEKTQFLGQLCLKAGLDENEWQKPGMKVSTYRTIKIAE